jgi:predicted nucleotidyltransferase
MSSVVDTKSVIDEIVSRIAARFSPDRIILFGSQARGDAHEDSDIDLLVLFDDVDDPHALAAEVYAALIGCSVLPKDIVVSTTARFERYRDVANTVYWPASREGKILYERAA